MVYEAIYGIEGLDLEVEFYKKSDRTQVAGAMTLRYVMYNYMKMESGHSLFAEIHQEGDLAMVQVVVGNMPEAERTILMINKQPAVFFTHFLKDAGLDPRFLDDLVKTAISKVYLHKMEG